MKGVNTPEFETYSKCVREMILLNNEYELATADKKEELLKKIEIAREEVLKAWQALMSMRHNK